MATRNIQNENHGRTSLDGRCQIVTLQATWDPVKKLRCSNRYMEGSTTVEEFLFEAMKNRCTFFFRSLMEKLCTGTHDALYVAIGPSHNLVIGWTKNQVKKSAPPLVLKTIYVTMEEASKPGVIMHDEHIVDFVAKDAEDQLFLIKHSEAPQFEIRPSDQCRTHRTSIAYEPTVELKEEFPKQQSKSTRSKIVEAMVLSNTQQPTQQLPTSFPKAQQYEQKVAVASQNAKVPRKQPVLEHGDLQSFAEAAIDFRDTISRASKPEKLLSAKAKDLLDKKSNDELEAALLIADMQGLREQETKKEVTKSSVEEANKKPLDAIKRKFASRSVGRRNVLSDPTLSPSKKKPSTTTSLSSRRTGENESSAKAKRKAEEEPELAAETLLQFKKRSPAQRGDDLTVKERVTNGVEMIDKNLEKTLTMRKLNALKNFYERAKELETYKEINGNCDVPQKYRRNPKLGVWVNKMRMEKKRYDKGEQTSLDEKKIAMLDNLEFNWGSKKGDEKWEEHFQSLVEAKQRTGTCNVPTKCASNPALGRFVSTQRCEYKKFMSGKRSLLDEKKIQRLTDLGFSWDALVARSIGPKNPAPTETSESGEDHVDGDDMTEAPGEPPEKLIQVPNALSVAQNGERSKS